MIVRLERALHEPGLASRLRHDSNGVGRHNPFQVTSYIISFQSQDILESQMVIDGDFLPLPLRFNQVDGTHIKARIAKILFKELQTDVLACDFSTEYRLVYFSVNGILSLTKIKWRTLSIFSNTEF